MAYCKLLALLALCSGQTLSPSPMPCAAPPGSFCSGGSALICPIGAYCAGGAAPNVSCYPVTACTVAGLSAQPPCYWNYTVLNIGPINPFGIISETPSSLLVTDWSSHRIRRVNTTTLTQQVVVGSGASSSTDGVGLAASTFYPTGIVFHSTLQRYVWSEFSGNKIRTATPSIFSVSTLAGSGAASFSDGSGASASFNAPHQIAVLSSGDIAVADSLNYRVRRVTPAGFVTTIAGNGVSGSADGVGALARFVYPNGLAANSSDFIFVSDWTGCTIRMITPSSVVSTIAGSATCGYADSAWKTSLFQPLAYLSLSPFNDIFVADQNGRRFRWLQFASNTVSTVIGNGASASVSGFFPSSRVVTPVVPYLASDGTLFAASLAQLGVAKCVPCPASFFCFSGAPVLCPAGSSCPLLAPVAP